MQGGAAPSRLRPTAIHSCKPASRSERDLRVDLQAVGRATGSPFRLPTPPTAAPTPAAPKGGASGPSEWRSFLWEPIGARLPAPLEGVRHGKRSSHPAQCAPGRWRPARDGQRPRRQGRQGHADRDQQRSARPGRGARGRGHRDPVDAVGQAGRERGAVPGQGLARQHRRPPAQQQLRQGRRDGLCARLHGRGDRLPRQQGRCRGAA